MTSDASAQVQSPESEPFSTAQADGPVNYEKGLAPYRIDLLSLGPRTPSLTLGRHVVVLDAFNTAEEQKLDDTMATRDPQAFEIQPGGELHEKRESIKNRTESISRNLQVVRQLISGLQPEQAEVFEDYCDSITSEFVRQVKEGPEDRPGENTWTSWLGEQADDSQLINFLQWHNHAIEQTVLHPKAAGEINRQKSEYKVGVSAGIGDGWLHPDSRAAIDGVDDTDVYAGDIFDTTFKEFAGYYRRGSRYVVAAAVNVIPDWDYKYICGEFRRTTKHEFNHAVLGRFDTRWLDEAVTEHIAQAMENGRPEVLNPWKRFAPKSLYLHERDLLDQLLQAGDEEIPVSMATRAYSEAGNSGEERAAFVAAVDRSWNHLVPEGESAYDNLNFYMEKLEGEFREEGSKMAEAGRRAAVIAARILKDYKILKDAEASPEQNWRLAGCKVDAEERIREMFAGESYWQVQEDYRADREKTAA